MLELGLNDLAPTRNLNLAAAEAEPEGVEVISSGSAARAFRQFEAAGFVTQVPTDKPKHTRFKITPLGSRMLRTFLQQDDSSWYSPSQASPPASVLTH